jgi:hypothetical protein
MVANNCPLSPRYHGLFFHFLRAQQVFSLTVSPRVNSKLGENGGISQI